MNAAWGKPAILIVDDEVILAGLYVKLLEQEGYTAAVASTPDDAIASVRQLSPTLILLDCKMPLFSGEELAAMLKAACPEQLRKAYLVGFSSFDPDVSLVAGFKQSVDRLVRKPDDIDAFVALVRELLEQARVKSEL